MRIIGGLYRGKKLLSPKSEQIRPTADKARESVFNVLYSKLTKEWSQIRLADIFAGTGAFGLEALSRGANHITMVDININDATRNVALFPNEKPKIKIIKADATSLPPTSYPFDVIFLDAPYQKGLTTQAITSILKQNWLAQDGICIAETAVDEQLEIPQSLQLIDNRCYGIAKFWFLTFKN